MNQLGTVYATKRRRRNGKSLKPTPKDGVTKSNPSKRHRERLNAELDTLASLLPFEQNILSKLDRLSILRLSVSYLRTKSYFQVVMHKDKEETSGGHRSRDLTAFDHTPLDGEMFLQALNGFLMILTCDGEVFFATHSIEGYLGFHQSDIVHQSVYELVHSEDREELQRQLRWSTFLQSESLNMSLQDVLQSDNCHLLERSFTVRFRCLLDNTSGFLRLDIRGRIKILHGQNRKSEEPPLGLFAICTPFGPPSLLEIPQKEVMFKSKHKLDLSLVSMDQRGKMLLGYSDSELANMGAYGLVHHDDLAYVASAHQELLKTGASGMIAYRFQTKDGQWQWLQTSSRLVYKNSKPDFVISTHRPLMDEEGRDLLGKRTMDFKVSYLDAGLANTYFTDSDQILPSSSSSSLVTGHQNSSVSVATSSATVNSATRVNRRYKTQLRDFLSTCRTKRKLSSHHSSTATATAATSTVPATTPPSQTTMTTVVTPMDYISPESAAYNMYSTPAVYPTTSDHHQHLPTYMNHSNFQHPGLYATAPPPPSTTLDNRYHLATSDNLFHQYRPLSTYYPDYHHTPSAAAAASYVTSNSFPGAATATPAANPYDPNCSYQTEKLYPCQQLVDVANTTAAKYSTAYSVDTAAKCLESVPWPYTVNHHLQPPPPPPMQMQVHPHHPHHHHHQGIHKTKSPLDAVSNHSGSSPILLTPKMEELKAPDHHDGLVSSHYPPPPPPTVSKAVTGGGGGGIHQDSSGGLPRQTVLMWGSNQAVEISRSPSSISDSGDTGYQTTPSNNNNNDNNNQNHNNNNNNSSASISSNGSLKNHHLSELSNPTTNGNPEQQQLCKWDSGTKTEQIVQNSSGTDSPHQHAHPHHNHHNSRVVMVL